MMDDHFDILQCLKENGGDVTCCDFGGNYLLAIGCSDKTVRILEWKKGLGFVDVSYSPLQCHKYGVTWVRFSPQGTMLASSSVDGTTVLWNVKTGIQIYTMVQASKCSVRRCEFTPDSTKLVTAGDDGVFCFWDLVHRCQISKQYLHNEEDACVQGLSVSPDSEFLLTGDSNGLMRIWCLSDMKKSHVQAIHAAKNVHDGINSCEFSPNYEILDFDTSNNRYHFATCGADGLINIWNMDVRRNLKRSPAANTLNCDICLVRTMAGHENDILSIRFNANGSLIASTGLDKAVMLWQVNNGECKRKFVSHTRYVSCCAFSRSTALLASGSNDKTVVIWDLNSGFSLDSELIKRCSTCSHFSQDNSGRLLAEELLIHRSENEVNRLELLQSLNLPSAVNSVCFLGNNTLATAGSDKTVSIWRRKREKDEFSLDEVRDGHRYSVNQVEISACGRKVVSCSMNGSMIVSDLEIGLNYELRSPECTSSIRSCMFSPNSELIAAAGDDQKVFIWDAKNLEFIKSLQEHKDAITCVAFSRDGKILASTCCAGDIRVYSLEGDSLYAAKDSVHDLGATSCDFSCQSNETEDGTDSPKEYCLATCGNDSLIKIWKVEWSQLSERKELATHGGSVTCVRFSPGVPNILASCAMDHTVRLWNSDSGECLHVFHHHESIVTACAFSQDSSLLASGSLDKSVLIWSLPKEYNFGVREIARATRKSLQHWSTLDTVDWLNELGFVDAAHNANRVSLDGQQITSLKLKDILDLIGVEGKDRNILKLHFHWVRNETKKGSLNSRLTSEAPHQFLCPITHEIMTDPVICSDGFTYERGAITEWLLCGRYASPMTNEPLRDLKFLPNVTLKTEILKYLYGEDVDD